MSGHSKWSKVKHQKASTDAVKGAAFTKASRAITIAVREGGGITDPAGNFRLRLALEKAREANMPKETIARAIEKATGGGESVIEQVQYEGYGPGGVAFLVEAATDNRNRTASTIKNTFERFGGSLAAPGAVSFQFQRIGMITVPKTAGSFDTVFEAALDAGAEDVHEQEDVFELATPPASLSAVREQLEAKGIVIDNTDLIMKPTSPKPLSAEGGSQAEKLTEQLEALDDVQHVYTNLAT